jgi:hypothetical protein
MAVMYVHFLFSVMSPFSYSVLRWWHRNERRIRIVNTAAMLPLKLTVQFFCEFHALGFVSIKSNGELRFICTLFNDSVNNSDIQRVPEVNAVNLRVTTMAQNGKSTLCKYGSRSPYKTN